MYTIVHHTRAKTAIALCRSNSLTHSKQKAGYYSSKYFLQVTQIGQTIEHFFLLLGSHYRYAELQYFFLFILQLTILQNENDSVIDFEC